jgi:hypothetical protein
MRIDRLAIIGSMYGVLLAGWAYAQATDNPNDLRQPTSVQRTAFDDNYVSFAEANANNGPSESPSNLPSPKAEKPATKTEKPEAKEENKEEGKKEEESKEDEGDKPWTLPQPRFLKCRDITLGGWTEIGTTFNNWGTNYNGLVTYPDRSDQLLLDQQWLFLDKSIKNDGCGWAWGGHVDLMYGSDAFVMEAVGLETSWNQHDYYQVAIPQFYLDVAYNDLTMRIGHFMTILGYEVCQAPQNFFYTHAYTHQYGEPFTHTGMLFMYKVNDQLSVSAGFHRSDDQFGPSYSLSAPDREVDHLGFLGGIKWVGPEKKLELAWSLSTSEKLEFGASQWISSLVATYHVSDKFKYVFQSDYGQVANSYQVDGVHANWYGINQYFLYEINKCWSAGLRAEWFSDREGVRVTGVRPDNPDFGQVFPGEFYEISLGLNWKPHANFTLRPEIRYDWYDPRDDVQFFPFDNGNRSHQWLFGMDAIVTY